MVGTFEYVGTYFLQYIFYIIVLTIIVQQFYIYFKFDRSNYSLLILIAFSLGLLGMLIHNLILSCIAVGMIFLSVLYVVIWDRKRLKWKMPGEVQKLYWISLVVFSVVGYIFYVFW